MRYANIPPQNEKLPESQLKQWPTLNELKINIEQYKSNLPGTFQTQAHTVALSCLVHSTVREISGNENPSNLMVNPQRHI